MQYIAQNFLQTEFQILDWIAGLRTEWLDALIPIISAFGNDGIGWIIVAVVLTCIPKYRKAGLTMGFLRPQSAFCLSEHLYRFQN
ncbi:MAG: hypothetical protein II268_00835 [Peptococcaceae bacterium]|nr:hypothetical protein [Peptococcaceae bacterium]